MSKPVQPRGFSAGGATLWKAMVSDGMAASDVALLTEACRAKDRLDQLDKLLRGDITSWVRLTHRLMTDDYELHIDDALTKANATAVQLRTLLAALPAVKAQPKASSALDQIAAARAKRESTPARKPGAARNRPG